MFQPQLLLLVYNLNLDALLRRGYASFERQLCVGEGKGVRDELRRVAEEIVRDESDHDGPRLLVAKGGDDTRNGVRQFGTVV